MLLRNMRIEKLKFPILSKILKPAMYIDFKISKHEAIYIILIVRLTKIYKMHWLKCVEMTIATCEAGTTYPPTAPEIILYMFDLKLLFL